MCQLQQNKLSSANSVQLENLSTISKLQIQTLIQNKRIKKYCENIKIAMASLFSMNLKVLSQCPIQQDKTEHFF